jgi:spermidine/putrescine-binding protein
MRTLGYAAAAAAGMALLLTGRAPHADAAHAFVDCLMRPNVAAANSNFVCCTHVNQVATPHLAKSREFTRNLNRTWTRFPTGR